MKKLLLFLFLLGPLLQGNKLYAQCISILTSGPGTNNQSVCLNQPIVNITYSATNADTATFILPQGIKGEWNKTTKVATLSGTPTQTGDFKYRISFRCATNFADSGNIKVNPLPLKPWIENPAYFCSGQDAEFTIRGANASLVNYRINGSAPKEVVLTGGSATVVVANAVAAQTLKLISITNPTSGCSLALTDSSTITMSPLPGASISGTTSACQDDSEPAVIFKGSNGTLPYIFAYTVNGGPVKTIPTNGSSTSATVQVPTNAAGSLTYNLISVTDSKGCIQTSFPADSATAFISILIKPFLTSSKSENICNRTTFNYQAISYPGGTSISWSRDLVAGILNPAQNDTSSARISETLVNITTQPVVVTYKFSLSNGACITTDSLKVSVNPTPFTKHLNDTAFCNGQAVSGFTFTTGSPAPAFKWSSTKNIGFGTRGSESIPSFIAANPGNIPDTATVSVSISVNNGTCQGQDTRFRIIVLPTPDLISTTDTSICNDQIFEYAIRSSVKNVGFSWERMPNADISPVPIPVTYGSVIQETLHNSSPKPVVVKYTIAMAFPDGSCAVTKTLNVTVNPTPVIDKINDTTFCRGNSVTGIKFSSSSPNSIFTWTCLPSIGFGESGTGNIPAFIAGNSVSDSVVATVTVSIKTGSGLCPGADAKFTITVLPLLKLSSTKDTSVCDNNPFVYTAKSEARGINFFWERPQVPGIEPNTSAGKGPEVSETLHNKTSQPIKVKYFFTLSTSPLCDTRDSVMVTVNPTPLIIPVSNKEFCFGETVNGINFISESPESSFAWTCDKSIGFGESGFGNIPKFIATNPGDSAIVANVAVAVKASKDQCPGPDSTRFTITVYPLLMLTSTKDTSVCDSVTFNYTARSSAKGLSFRWTRPEVPDIEPKSATGDSSLVSETLHNKTGQPVKVKYFFTLSASPLCYTRDSVMVTVNPTPRIDPVSNKEFCFGETVDGINFISASPESSFAWTCDKSIGFGKSGYGNIPAFNATNPGNSPIVANIAVAVNASQDQCPGTDSTRFTITVYPLLMFTSTKDTSVCDNFTFNYTARSSAKGLGYSWTRPEVQGISNQAANGNDSIISETLHNTTTQPVVVKYFFTLSASPRCFIQDSVKLTVSPTPVIIPIDNVSYCNGTIVNGINFQSASPESSYTWSCDTSIGFGKSGNGNIPVFTATNTGSLPVTATITVAISAGKDNCIGESRAFKITVNPSPPRPDFTWLSLHGDVVCKGSENINFNIISPDNSISYLWTSNSPDVIIRNANVANTAISFPVSGNFTIRAFSINSSNGGCTDSVVQTVKISETPGIDERRIIVKQPGNLLFYPDNSMNPLNGYQWGYDSLSSISPARTYAPPKNIDGQVYQFFIPEKRFLVSNTLDTTRYAYWVLVQEGDCYSKVYYNGPYSRLKTGATASENKPAELTVYPVPNNGNFEIILEGNIYGTVSAQIYNSSGQVVFSNNFEKNMPVVNKSYNLPHLQGGLYFLVMNSSDLKKVVARFIIQH